MLQASCQRLSVLFVIFFIKFGSLVTEKSLFIHWSLIKWQICIEEYAITKVPYMLSLNVAVYMLSYWSLMRDCITTLNYYVSKPQTRAYVFFHNCKSIRWIPEFFLHCSIVVHTTLSQIQWCDFCIENLNLDFVFVIPTSSLFSLFFTGFKC